MIIENFRKVIYISMLKKVNNILGIITILLLIILPFKYLGIVNNVPFIVEYWPILILLMGFINLIDKKKTSIGNLSAILIGLGLLLSKIGIVIY